MATTPNYGWVTPAPTDLVTDLPADFEVFADAVDADLAGLLGGTTGQVLTKNSATDHDFGWAAAGGGISALSLIGTSTSMSGSSTINLTGISDKKVLILRIEGWSSNNAGGDLQVRFNNDSGNDYNYVQWRNAMDTDLTESNAAFATDRLLMNSEGNVANTWNTLLVLYGAGGAGWTWGNWFTSCATNNSGKANSGNFMYEAAAAITQINIITPVGTWDAGTIRIYGA